MDYKLFSLAVFAGLVLSSCNYRVEKSSGGSAASSQDKSAGSIDFKEIKERIFAPKCISCHGQYESYSNVKFELSSIRAQVLIDRMPKSGGPLTLELKALLSAWSDAGAPETLASAPIDSKLPRDLQPNYDSISLVILGPKCTACHNPQGQAKFLDLSSRLAIFSQRTRVFGPGAGQKLIDFDKPEDSYLLKVVNDPVEPMPPTWSGLPRLTGSEVQVIQDWIRLGLP